MSLQTLHFWFWSAMSTYSPTVISHFCNVSETDVMEFHDKTTKLFPCRHIYVLKFAESICLLVLGPGDAYTSYSSVHRTVKIDLEPRAFFVGYDANRI